MGTLERGGIDDMVQVEGTQNQQQHSGNEQSQNEEENVGAEEQIQNEEQNVGAEEQQSDDQGQNVGGGEQNVGDKEQNKEDHEQNTGEKEGIICDRVKTTTDQEKDEYKAEQSAGGQEALSGDSDQVPSTSKQMLNVSNAPKSGEWQIINLFKKWGFVVVP